jgi:type IV secretory pathway TraG/TraD family ATPase VirD4
MSMDENGNRNDALMITSQQTRISALERLLAECIVVINGCKPIDESRTEYFRRVVSKAYALLGEGPTAREER